MIKRFGNVYDVGMDRWFGHDRVEAYVFFAPWAEASVTGEQTFDTRGRMIAEHVATSDLTIDASRERRFEGATLLSDERVLRRDGATLTSALRFEHDDDGRVVTRSYELDGQLAGQHRWTYDGDAITRHEIASAIPLGEAGFGMTIPDLSLLSDELAPPIVHERVTTGDEQTWLRDGATVSVRRLDGAGRVTWRSLWEDTSEQFAYDAAGELVSYAQISGAETYLRLAYEHDAAGHLTARTWSYGAIGDRDALTYTCW